MNLVIPAILPYSREEFERGLARFSPIEEIDTIQLDQVDGRFAAPASWPFNSNANELAKLRQIPGLRRFRYDVDLMVEDQESAIAAWIKLGATRLTLHAEPVALPRLLALLAQKFGHEPRLSHHFLSIGIALAASAELAAYEPYFARVDYVQCMGIARAGAQGLPFDRRALDTVKKLRRAHPDLPIQVDGAVSLQTAPELLTAGASRLVVGSALMRAPDVVEEIRKFNALAEEFGVFA